VFKEALKNIQAEGGVDVQVRLNRADSKLQWLNIKGKTETNKAGKAVKLVGVINDITNDKIIERHKDDFISIASHELKTPVTSLKGSVQMLQRDANRQSDRTKRLVAQASRGINRISLIIDDLLNAGKNYRDQIELRKTNFNLFELVQEIVELFASTDVPAVTITGKKNIVVHADSERIGRVLTNLISNAVKYAPGTAEIKVELIDHETYVKISVIDQGPGIVAEKIPLLFDRYYQAAGQQEQNSGLGLGLFICANIVRKHGGEIGVDSVPGKRTGFWFTLPKSAGS
jgi:two-component system CheB/CheR fusion protein